MAGDRKVRVAQVVRETLTSALSYGEVKDPRVAANGLVTITHVEVSGDLRLAKVYLVVHDGDARLAVKGLAAAAGFLRHQLAERIQARVTPELRFFVDEQFERGQRMEALLSKIATEKKDD
jgi:ribosome-binding factor A